MNKKCFIGATILAAYSEYETADVCGVQSNIRIMIACGWLNGLNWLKSIDGNVLGEDEAISHVLSQVRSSKTAEVYAKAYGQSFHVLFQETEHKKVNLTVTLLGGETSPLNLAGTAKVFLGLVERYTIEELQGFKAA